MTDTAHTGAELALTDARDPLRPSRLSEFGGQDQVVKELSIVLRAALARHQLPDHMLLAGPPGLGKTSLAHIIANELGLPLVITSGPAIEKPSDMTSILSGLGGATVVFIDEIHRLDRVAEELLYPAMEDGKLDIIIGEGAKARAVSIPVKPFVLIGATTQIGALSAPLRDRFGFVARLSLYEPEALGDIVSRSASLLGVNITPEGAQAVASRSRGTPRVANTWLRRVRDWAQLEDVTVVDEDVAVEALQAFNVDELGLDRIGRELLERIIKTFGGGPVGLGSIASAIGESTQTIEEVYEPYLLRQGLLVRTPRGRAATSLAYKHLGLEPTAASFVLEDVEGSQESFEL